MKDEFSIEKLLKKSQFYNILTCINHKQFVVEFEKWVQQLMQQGMQGKTVAIDGKAICSTAKLSRDKSIITMANAIIASSGLVITLRECKNKNEGEIGF